MRGSEIIGLITVGVGAAGLLYFIMTTVLATFGENPLFSIPLIITFLAILYAIIKAIVRKKGD
jgi:hypothetical protein